jgi:tripartite-type tricarboxylate transporter receptor subunit TctC
MKRKGKKMRKCTMFIFLILSLLVLEIISQPCTAQEKFPTKPITLLEGYAAGGAADRGSRTLAEATSKYLGQPIVVLNKPGGGTSVMLGELKRAQPDGYTLGNLMTGGVISAGLRKVPYDPINDFDPILQYAIQFKFAIAVRADSPFKTLKDMIDYAAANPNKIKYGTMGAGSPPHFLMIELGHTAKAKWTHIPFNSGPESVSALLGGHIDCSVGSHQWEDYVESGRLRLLVCLAEERMPSFPNLPTLKDLGYNIAQLTFFGIVGPKGVPKDRMKILHDTFYKGMNDPLFVNHLKNLDTRPYYRNPEETAKYIKKLYETAVDLAGEIEKK